MYITHQLGALPGATVSVLNQLNGFGPGPHITINEQASRTGLTGDTPRGYSLFVELRIVLRMSAAARQCKPQNRATPRKKLDEEALAVLCKALAHPARVRLLNYLADYGTCYFGKLTDILPLAPSTISQHVTVLKEAGLILGSDDSTRTCYCVNAERLEELKELIAAL